jgi:hypothetical protein
MKGPPMRLTVRILETLSAMDYTTTTATAEQRIKINQGIRRGLGYGLAAVAYGPPWLRSDEFVLGSL